MHPPITSLEALLDDWPYVAYLPDWSGLTHLAVGRGLYIEIRQGQVFLNGVLQQPHALESCWQCFKRVFKGLQHHAPWYGALSYHANGLFEAIASPLQADKALFPDLCFFQAEQYWQSSGSEWFTMEAQPPNDTSFFNAHRESASFTQADFEQAAQRIQESIVAGELYQANLSIRYRLQADSVPLASFWRQLLKNNPSPYSGVFQGPWGQIWSNSPERLIQYNAFNNTLETRPIAGTRGRGKTSAEDEKNAVDLTHHPKERAEHLMLVDLERNDMGRVCVPGSVMVTDPIFIERYTHVMHLVSRIEGQKTTQASVWDVLEAVFPGGTITGCPKIRCMNLLSHLEPVPRGFYTGSLGYILPDGSFDFNILIRSLFYSKALNTLDYHVGAGIVADSVAPWEYKECGRKAQAIRKVLYG
jgi:anthranilate/para-aminobenzoate synthase component I